jgi:hypothetical protein
VSCRLMGPRKSTSLRRPTAKLGGPAPRAR